jgi:APA family basic amino acid/polyamine antiporter
MTDPFTTPGKLPAPHAFTKEPPRHEAEAGLDTEFKRGLGLFDATMVVVGSMIGSGIFIVSADIARLTGAPGWLLVAWLITGVLTVTAALSYGELAALMPRAGGQYVYLREAFSPLWGFLYGWTLFLVIQTGTIAAVGVAFAKFGGVLWPEISQTRYLIAPVQVVPGYAVSLSTAQLLGILMIALLTATNVLGLEYGKWVQNLFTVSKTGALFGLIVLGLVLGWNADAVSSNFSDLWSPRGNLDNINGLTALSAFGLFVALCVSQTGSLFSADSWNNVTFTAGEVRNPRRNLALALGLGTGLVITLYVLANVAYLVTLPVTDIQTAAEDRVGTATLERIFPGIGVSLMAAAIMASTFGCANGLILAGARAYYAMARDGLFFRAAGRLNAARVPAWGLVLQGLWAALLVLPRTIKPPTPAQPEVQYGNLYGDLLDYIISAALLFYILTIAGLFRLRVTRPDAPRPYRAFGYPVVPALYILGAATLVGVLVVYRPMTTWPGLVLVLLGVPVYFLWRGSNRRDVPDV